MMHLLCLLKHDWEVYEFWTMSDMWKNIMGAHNCYDWKFINTKNPINPFKRVVEKKVCARCGKLTDDYDYYESKMERIFADRHARSRRIQAHLEKQGVKL